MAFSMPLLGMNNQPIVDLPRFGKIKLTKHDHLIFLPVVAIKYFIEPIIATINYADKFNYDFVNKFSPEGIARAKQQKRVIRGFDIKKAEANNAHKQGCDPQHQTLAGK